MGIQSQHLVPLLFMHFAHAEKERENAFISWLTLQILRASGCQEHRDGRVCGEPSYLGIMPTASYVCLSAQSWVQKFFSPYLGPGLGAADRDSMPHATDGNVEAQGTSEEGKGNNRMDSVSIHTCWLPAQSSVLQGCLCTNTVTRAQCLGDGGGPSPK